MNRERATSLKEKNRNSIDVYQTDVTLYRIYTNNIKCKTVFLCSFIFFIYIYTEILTQVVQPFIINKKLKAMKAMKYLLFELPLFFDMK